MPGTHAVPFNQYRNFRILNQLFIETGHFCITSLVFLFINTAFFCMFLELILLAFLYNII